MINLEEITVDDLPIPAEEMYEASLEYGKKALEQKIKDELVFIFEHIYRSVEKGETWAAFNRRVDETFICKETINKLIEYGYKIEEKEDNYKSTTLVISWDKSEEE